MNQKTLRVLGGLKVVKEKTWNRLCDELPHGEDSEIVVDLKNTLRLVDHIRKQVEEKARGFSKSKLPYLEAGAFLVEHASLPYSELHREVTSILLSRP